jgi:hypothetical protein
MLVDVSAVSFFKLCLEVMEIDAGQRGDEVG